MEDKADPQNSQSPKNAFQSPKSKVRNVFPQPSSISCQLSPLSSSSPPLPCLATIREDPNSAPIGGQVVSHVRSENCHSRYESLSPFFYFWYFTILFHCFTILTLSIAITCSCIVSLYSKPSITLSDVHKLHLSLCFDNQLICSCQYLCTPKNSKHSSLPPSAFRIPKSKVGWTTTLLSEASC